MEFKRFNNLPKEIRLMIWEESLPGPRVVYISYSTRGYTSTTPIPILLSVNAEARKVALKIYKLCFGQDGVLEESARVGSNESPMIYFNFDIDTIYFGLCPTGYHSYIAICSFLNIDDGNPNRPVKEEERKQLRRIAVGRPTFAQFSNLDGMLSGFLGSVPNMDELVLLCECDSCISPHSRRLGSPEARHSPHGLGCRDTVLRITRDPIADAKLKMIEVKLKITERGKKMLEEKLKMIEVKLKNTQGKKKMLKEKLKMIEEEERTIEVKLKMIEKKKNCILFIKRICWGTINIPV